MTRETALGSQREYFGMVTSGNKWSQSYLCRVAQGDHATVLALATMSSFSQNFTANFANVNTALK
jgi:hypothetical protein